MLSVELGLCMANREQVIRCSGFTLVELIIAIVVLNIAVLGVYSASSEISRHSADPIFRTQALAIAKSTLTEIRLKKYAPIAQCPSIPGAGGRADYTHICHYTPWSDAAVKDQFGSALAQFSGYSITVTIRQSEKLGPEGSSVLSSDVLLITVAVDHQSNSAGGALAQLSAYRVNRPMDKKL